MGEVTNLTKTDFLIDHTITRNFSSQSWLVLAGDRPLHKGASGHWPAGKV